MDYLYWLDQIQPSHRTLVGDKAFYLGSLLQRGYPVVSGCVISAIVFQEFLEQINWLEPLFADLPNSSLHVDVNNSRQLQAVAQQIRQAIQITPLPESWLAQIVTAMQHWQAQAMILRPSFSLSSGSDPTVSMRTTGLLEAQVCRAGEAIAHSLKRVWAELFRARSLLYWQRLGVSIQQIQLAVLVQPLWSAIASGESQVDGSELEIRSVWGLGNALVNGEVTPDRYRIHTRTGLQTYQPGHKTRAYRVAAPASEATRLASDGSLQAYPLELPQQTQESLTPEQLQQLLHLTQQAIADFGTALKLEWTLCEQPGTSQPAFYFTQVIPQLTASARTNLVRRGEPEDNPPERLIARPIVRVEVQEDLPPLVPPPAQFPPRSALAGLAAAPGKVMAIAWIGDPTVGSAIDIPPGIILVAPVITPDWLLQIGQVAGIVTEQGGITSHGAILAREMGVPAIVGVNNATRLIQTGDRLFLDGDSGEIYWTKPGPALAEPDESVIARLGEEPEALNLLPASPLPPIPLPDASSRSVVPTGPRQPRGRLNATQLLVTLSQPNSISQAVDLSVDGVGLLRSELMILRALEQRHPNWWLRQGRQAELIDRIASQVQQFVHAFNPRPVFYRSLDLRSHEFPTLGAEQMVAEVNPMLGLRGTFSYQVNPELFEVELAALKQVQQWGYSNLRLILPFVRTVEEFMFCRQRVEQAGLTQNTHFKLWIMAEVPSVLLLLPDYFSAGVQGVAIGSNDLTQLLLGIDRDQHQMASVFDPHHPAVMQAIHQIVQAARQAGIPCSICGQAPGQSPAMIESLVRWGITAISVNPGEVEQAYGAIAHAEQRLLLEAARHRLDG